LLWEAATEPKMNINRYRLTFSKGADGDDEGLFEMERIGPLVASSFEKAADFPADLRSALVDAFADPPAEKPKENR